MRAGFIDGESRFAVVLGPFHVGVGRGVDDESGRRAGDERRDVIAVRYVEFREVGAHHLGAVGKCAAQLSSELAFRAQYKNVHLGWPLRLVRGPRSAEPVDCIRAGERETTHARRALKICVYSADIGTDDS